MLNELITWVLNTYLGKYLENFNPAQLSFALLSGEVELENVPIRKDALQSLGIPIQAFSGNIGKIKLQIPVRQFLTAPWCIIIERIYGVIGPKNLNDWDDEKERLSEFEFKLAKLDAIEAKWRVEKGYQTEHYYSTSYSSWLNYGTTLATNILENLELKINDVHIRYEDTVTIENVQFCAGVKISSLTMQSCDYNWIVGSKATNNQNISYKLLELKGLSLYWDKLNAENLCSNLSSKELFFNMTTMCDSKQHRYIISPISATAQCKRERCKQAIRSKMKPRLSCEILIAEFKVGLSDYQYKQIMACAGGLAHISQIRSYRIIRPTCTIKENAILWWKYATRCHGYIFYTKDIRRVILKENLRYINCYKRLAMNPNENFSKEDQEFKLHMEKSRSFTELQTLRSVCFSYIYAKGFALRARNINQGKGMLYQWFPNWWGWYGNNDMTNQNQLQDEAYRHLEDDIFTALEDSMENNSFSKRDAVFGYFTFILLDGKILICTENNRDDDISVKLEMEFHNLIWFIEMKPRFNSYLIGLSVGSICLKDKLTELTEFPFLIKPQSKETETYTTSASTNHTNFKRILIEKDCIDKSDPWFQLEYEKRPMNVQSDFRLVAKSRSLDIVYNKSAFEWLLLFLTEPLKAFNNTYNIVSLAEGQDPDRLKFFKNWKHIFLGHKEHRLTWSFEIDISAPRIIFFENYLEKNTAVVLVDFGRFEMLKNESRKKKVNILAESLIIVGNVIDNTESQSEENDLFMTPCCTPPGSQTSHTESPIMRLESDEPFLAKSNTDLAPNAFHNSIYDKYVINLTDLQVIVCRNDDRAFGSFKNSSNFHLLDKFDISLELETRVIYTLDPDYPSLTLFGSLPRIVAHVNENKINEFSKIISPLYERMFEYDEESINFEVSKQEKKMEKSEDIDSEQSHMNTNVVVVQFVIGQITLEVQTQEKSIAELQVIGVRAGVNKRSDYTHISMSVHGLLLVDAMQSFGPDFELLAASHRHVGMDSVSGKLKRSEPCSPMSPASPDSLGHQHPKSPQMTKRAATNFEADSCFDFEESHALITIEVNFIKTVNGDEPMQIINITFNNLDIIANQETTVELLAFMKRILHARKNNKKYKAREEITAGMSRSEDYLRSEISFDFRRLNILVMRTVHRENFIIGYKVGTLTMSEAKIHATLGTDICVAGSLGGVQIIDITSDGIKHQRIFSVGKDPLTDSSGHQAHDLLCTLANEMYGPSMDKNQCDQLNALNFKLSYKKGSAIFVTIRMASVWYTHCVRFIQEISLCISQFKQHFKNFASTIRIRATDMAMGLVQHLCISETCNAVESENNFRTSTEGQLSMDVILNSPVLVLPRSSQSSDVLVANLGKINVYNTHERNVVPSVSKNESEYLKISTKDNYFVDIRNMNLFSLNTSQRKRMQLTALPKVNEFYSCKSDAVSILDDTAMLFKITKMSTKIKKDAEWSTKSTLEIEGSVTQVLQFSLSHVQYQQLSESLSNVTNDMLNKDSVDNIKSNFFVVDETKNRDDNFVILDENLIKTLKFTVPTLKIHLKNEHNEKLINITFREFSILSKQAAFESEIEVLLRSILIEDLKCSVESRFRNLVDSSSACKLDINLKREHSSISCPNLVNLKTKNHKLSVSMPSKLNDSPYKNIHTNNVAPSAHKMCDENLVMYKSYTTKPKKYDTKSEIACSSFVDFNCLNLTISVDRWLMVLEFFGLLSADEIRKEIATIYEEAKCVDNVNSELKVSVRSLNLILVKNETELSKANISNAFFKVTKENIIKIIEGRLGSVSLYDLTPFGNMYREKFSTTGPEALSFLYKRLNCDETSVKPSLSTNAMLQIQMASVKYIHTKRFLIEMHLFIKELLELQTPVIKKIKKVKKERSINTRPTQISLKIFVASPIILLPLSYHSNQLIVAHLGEFTLTNNFHFASDPVVISRGQKTIEWDEILDVMHIDLVNINLFAGERLLRVNKSIDCLNVGDFSILKLGNNLFKETCYLQLQVERNTDSFHSHNCPDISVKGTLSKLSGIITLEQYKLIRGFFTYNLGEVINDIDYNYSFNLYESVDKLLHTLNRTDSGENNKAIWIAMSINLQLENVSILLADVPFFGNQPQALACINFIKSSLEIDSFTDGSQDIDLVSSEILIVDSRTNKDMSHISENIFKHILKPTQSSIGRNIVQAEIHSRRRLGSVKYTILLNNMRIMAILDFLESLKYFFKEEQAISSPNVSPVYNNKIYKEYTNQCSQKQQIEGVNEISPVAWEIVLNITDSEIVFVEKIDQPDANAIILKSTTVFSYKPNDFIPLSININHLEIFSCTLDSEDESALSIIDPFTLNIELRENCFYILIQKQLNIRLSYNDVKLFTLMLNLIPKQTKFSRKLRLNNMNRANENFEIIAPLIAMGFSKSNCWQAMEINNYKLNEAALWLAQQKQKNAEANNNVQIRKMVLNASCISVCIIDDCLDADVPLLEVSLNRLMAKQNIENENNGEISSSYNKLEGQFYAIIGSDYYNRHFSGWEPVIEPWECSANWTYTATTSPKNRSVNMYITSLELLRVNITSTLIELWNNVRKNWTKDYYDSATVGTLYNLDGLSNFRRRSPFVPFALQNLTGESLLFKTIFSQPGGITRTDITQHNVIHNWIQVQQNEIRPFDFGPQAKLRHMDSHKLNLHQIFVQVNGWTLIGPISIDKVGVFFRYSSLDLEYNRRTRIVFDISLVGSARKMITIRSALNVVNKLNRNVFLKMAIKKEDKTIVAMISPNEHFSVPLRFADSHIYIKPFSPTSSENNYSSYGNYKKYKIDLINKIPFSKCASIETDDFGFCTRGILWTGCSKDFLQDLYTSYGQNNSIFHILVEINKDKYPVRDTYNLPAHTIKLLPPIKIKNLLCCDVLYKITEFVKGRIGASDTVDIYNVNTYESFNLTITLDNYKLSTQLKVPVGHCGIVEPKLKLNDFYKRELYLRVSIQSFKGKGMEIFISAPIWIINKTGLPLLFRQEGTICSASGQFEEHEKARVVSPLMFSFSDQEGSPSLEIRLGNIFGNNNPWCKGFNVHKQIIHRQLKSEHSNGCYAIGINVRKGRGVYAYTTFVILSPRFQLFNKSTHKLEFGQKCDIFQAEALTTNKIITALPGSNFPFHWPNSHQEPLLCVRFSTIEFCHWSNGIPINEVQSLYINVRSEFGEMFFLRLEVIPKGATYILLFSDAHTLPPPIRIENYSEVLIHFHQHGCKPHWRTSVRPQCSLAYALDDPLGLQILQIEGPGGNTIEFPLKKFEISRSITYANFIYIAFKETFTFCSTSTLKVGSNLDVEIDAQLVLGVRGKNVIIVKKCAGDRSQLWLMNSNGQLEHEGSSPPTEFGKINESRATRMVLDLENAPNPTLFTNLVIRPPNKQRCATQTWRFEKGRLMCHANMCVQARDGVYGLQVGYAAVLGIIESKTRKTNFEYIPFEQSIEIQKFRPGSGHLEVRNLMNGPIKIIQIRDVKSNQDDIIITSDPSWNHASINNRHDIDESINKNILDKFSLLLKLQKGIGVSVITKQPREELAYLTFDNIVVDILLTSVVKSIDLKVHDLQIDNQLLDTSCPVLLHTIKMVNEKELESALVLRAKLLPSPNENAVIFEYFMFDLKPCSIYMEERLILKTAIFLGYGIITQHNTTIDFEYDTQNIEKNIISKYTQRFYFGSLCIELNQIRLTMLTAPKLTQELSETKKLLGLTLLKFEDAVIEFDKFSDKHHFETLDVYLKAIRTHYINQFKWHAASIIGSVDFLGNPLGFANDVSEGVFGLIFEGSVKSLVKNVTHGASNFTAKLIETLSDNLGRVVLDEHDHETRQKFLELPTSSSGEHLAAGIKGFGFGMLGGATSIVRHTYVGAQKNGFPGLITGLGKGVVGTVTKPIIGILDLASETASAVRESSKGPRRSLPDRRRLPRCVSGAPGGLLPTYSYRQSRGQQYLYLINRRNFSEKLMYYEPNLCNDLDAKLRLLVSTEYVRIFSRCEEDPTIMFECHLSEVLSCHVLITNAGGNSTSPNTPNFYIEISTNSSKISRPRVRCQNEEVADRAARCVNYAKSVFDERELSISND